MRFVAIVETVAMKKLYVLSFSSFFVTGSAVLAQPFKGCWEVFASVGQKTPADILATSYNSERTFVEFEKHNIYMAGFKYYFSNKLAAGITVAQHSFAHSYDNKYGGYTYAKKYNAVSVCPELKIVYYQFRYLQMYGTVAPGLFIANGFEADSSYRSGGPTRYQRTDGADISFYASPLGIKVGTKLSAFAEVGIGFRGLYNFGVTYTWGRYMNRGKKI